VRLAGEGGEDAWVGVSTSLIHEPEGGVVGGAFLMADLTETKRLRQRVALKDRLSAMGEISAGLAHELRNSLATLLGYCRLIDRELEEDAACRPS
jgi:two-component system sporulation sensor kinase A